METDSCVTVKLEPESAGEASHDESVRKVMPGEEINIKREPIYEDDCGEKLESMAEGISAPESILVKLEPKYYSSGDGQGVANASSVSQNTPLHQASTSNSKTPKTFEDLLEIWEKNEETEEVGFFFAYCRATADCGGYFDESDTDMDLDDDEENIPKQNRNTSNYYFGRNGYKWSKSPVPLCGNRHNTTPSCTIPSEMDPYNIWTHLIDERILREILKWTNVKFTEYRALIGDPSISHLDNLDMNELKAFFASIMFSVICHLNIHQVHEMYDEGIFNRPIFECIMSKNRFMSILNCLSFGDPQLENESSDRNVAVLFEKFVENCGKMYKGSSYAVIAETVVPFWGDAKDDRFPWKYSERPHRDGFRLPCVFDVQNGFLYNMYIPFTDLGNRGFIKEEQKFRKGTQLALLLTQPLHGKNINLTCKKEFMSLELIHALKKQGLTCVGPLEGTHKEIPTEFLPSKKRKKGTTLYGYSENVTLMSYMNKNKKATIIASSKPCEIDEKAEIPTLWTLYKKTSYARMLTSYYDVEYNFFRRTKLVSVALFYKLFGFSLHNTHVLYSLNMKKKVNMSDMINIIAMELSRDHLIRRSMDESVPPNLRTYVVKYAFANQKVEEDESDEEEFSSLSP